MSSKQNILHNTQDQSVSEEIENTLYGETASIRDQARAELIRSGSAKDLLEVSAALSSTLDTTRRRATRLLSDIQLIEPALLLYVGYLRISTGA